MFALLARLLCSDCLASLPTAFASSKVYVLLRLLGSSAPIAWHLYRLLFPMVLVLLRLLLGASVLDRIMALDGILRPGLIRGHAAIACSVPASAVESYATQLVRFRLHSHGLWIQELLSMWHLMQLSSHHVILLHKVSRFRRLMERHAWSLIRGLFQPHFAVSAV